MSQPGSLEEGGTAFHVAVMASEVVELFRPLGLAVIVDATYGGGGHSVALLDALDGIEILAFDRDPDVAEHVKPRPNLRFAQGRFSELGRLVSEAGLAESPSDVPGGEGSAVAGVLFDLGVSSHQLDTPSRGFSYRRAGPLDMRMNVHAGLSADVVVNTWPEKRLADIIRRYGDERFAARIARRVVAARPLRDTAGLAVVVADSVPAAVRRRRHSARRTFQAIRIAVNDELRELEIGLDAALELVAVGGRVAVITYHSLEDKLVAHRFAAGTAGCECPPDLPVCVCGRTAELRSLTRRGLVPSPEELDRNRRARSARLRAVEKIAA